MSSTGDDDPFRPPSGDDGRGQSGQGGQGGQSGQGDGRTSQASQGSQPGSWGWGQPPQDPARASWESSHAHGSAQGPAQGQGQAPQGPPGGQGPPPAWNQPAPSGEQAYGQAYGQPYGAGGQGGYPGYGGYAPQDHPRATIALVLGLVSLIGGLFCGLPLLASPFALAIGRKAVREIDAGGGRMGGRGQAMAGYVMGIIGTVLLAVGLVIVGLFIAALTSSGFS